MSKEEQNQDPFEIQPVRFIGKTEEIPDPNGEGGDPNYLSLDDKLGIIELEISRTFTPSDTAEPVTSLKIQAPSTADLKQANGNVYILKEKCIVGWTPSDIKKFLAEAHGRDGIRLQKLIRHFLD